VMRQLNAPIAKAVIGPFLPKSLLGQRLHDLFKLVEASQEATGARKLEACRRASASLEAYTEEAEQFGTRYTKWFLGGIARTLSSRLRADIAENPLTGPARLVVQGSEKKYPLLEEGKRFGLSIVVSNEGSGYASDVSLSATLSDNIELEKQDHFVGDLEA